VKATFAATLALISFVPNGANAQQVSGEPLAAVAHRLGFVYAYLGPDDEVSLTGHGITVLVRPGDPFFSVNDRREPVRGETPRYRDSDIVVSRHFVRQLTEIERAAAFANDTALAKSYVSGAGRIDLDPHVSAAPRKVATVDLSPVKGTEDVLVSGNATPGSLVAIVLKAIASPYLPTIFLNRSFAVAGTDGKYEMRISTAPEYFNGSTFLAEASSVDDASPVVARYAPQLR